MTCRHSLKPCLHKFSHCVAFCYQVLNKTRSQVMCQIIFSYCRNPVTRTLKGNQKMFELAGNSSYRGKFQWNFDQGKGNLVWVNREFKLSISSSYQGSTVLILRYWVKYCIKLLLFVRYFCEDGMTPLWEKWFHCEDLGTQLPPIIKE